MTESAIERSVSRSVGRRATGSRVCAQRLTDAARARRLHHGGPGRGGRASPGAPSSTTSRARSTPCSAPAPGRSPDAVLGDVPRRRPARQPGRRPGRARPRPHARRQAARPRATVELGRRVLSSEPAAARRRPRAVRGRSPSEFVELVLEREGAGLRRRPGPAAAAGSCSRLLDAALDELLADPATTAPWPRSFDDAAARRPRPARLTHPCPAPPTHPRGDHTMATLLYRLGKTAYRRWPFFIAGWLVAHDRRRHRRRRRCPSR